MHLFVYLSENWCIYIHLIIYVYSYLVLSGIVEESNVRDVLNYCNLLQVLMWLLHAYANWKRKHMLPGYRMCTT